MAKVGRPRKVTNEFVRRQEALLTAMKAIEPLSPEGRKRVLSALAIFFSNMEVLEK